MKIIELVEDQRTDELVGALARGASSLWRGAKTGARELGTRPVVKPGETARTYTKSFWGKYARSKALRQMRNARQVYRARAENFARDQLGDDILTWATRIAIADGIYDYYSAKYLLDDLLKAGDITREQYDSEMTQLRGGFWTAILVPKFAAGLAKGTGNIVGSILTKLGAPRTGEAVRFWNGILAKGGEAAGLAVLSTDAGKKWLADSWGFLVTGTGSAVNLLADFADFIKAGYQVATGTEPAGSISRKTDQPKDGETTGDQPADSNNPWASELNKAIGGQIKGTDPFKGTGRQVGFL
jgi:hypothetical protein